MKTVARGKQESVVKKKPKKPIPRNPRKSSKVTGTFPNNSHPKTGPTVQAIIETLLRTGGMISKAARILHCDVKTITNRMKESNEIQEALEETEARRLDEAETMLDQNIENGNQKAIEFFLKNKGRARGYGNESEEKPDLGVIIETFEAQLAATKPPSFSDRAVLEVAPNE